MKGTSAEFFMDQYFAFNKIDAFFCWEPFISKAEVITKNHRDEAIKIHSEVVGIDVDIAKALFSENGYKIKLDQSLLILLEDEARWAIDYKYVKSSKVPNYLNFIDTTLLKEIHPEDMTIIGDGK